MPAELLYSALLNHAPHGFTTRRGGVSHGAFATLNFGNPGQLPAGMERDSREQIRTNFGLLLEALGTPKRRVVQVHQVHGAEVHVVRAGSGGPQIEWGTVRADALVTDDPASVVCVRVADCVPVLIASGDGRVVAAVHAGWRGVVAGVAIAAVAAMEDMGAETRTMAAAIGPCISARRFEVGPEVVAAFVEAFGGGATDLITPGEGDRALIDLQQALRLQLCGAGLRAERIETLARCTVDEPEVFFSHRRGSTYGPGVTGRMIGVIGPREAYG